MKQSSIKLLILAISLVLCSNSFAQNTAETFVYGDAMPNIVGTATILNPTTLVAYATTKCLFQNGLKT
jgi:hypothetical protein